MRTQLSKFALGLALLSPALAVSQEGKVQLCDTYGAMEEAFKADPKAKARYEATDKAMQANYEAFEASRRFNANAQAKTMALTDFTVPVVFHILHEYGQENISDQVCIDALAQVNRDYARLGADTGQIYKTFKDGTYAHTPAGYIDSHIKFKFAQKDPNGNCTNGIVHHYDSRTVWDRDNTPTSILYAGITWPATKYLNIIIVKQIVTATATGGGIVVGYTYRPGTWSANAAPDAIVYTWSYLGGLSARALSHEIGHWLGLPHTWGNTNAPNVACGDDGIYDTPRTRGHEFTCPSSANSNTCTQGTIPTVNGVPVYAVGEDNVQNFMDYSSCPGNVQNFTTGQIYYMQSVLSGTASSLLGLNPSGSNRPNVVSPSNMTATGVNSPSPCALIADWISTNGSYTVCSGGSLQVKDYSYNGIATSWQWTGNNGVTAASATSITTITFPVAGVTTVTLTVANAAGTQSSFSRTVQVLDGTAGITTPFLESFENGLPTNWSVVNPDAGSSQWTGIGDNIAYDGASSYYISGAEAGANQEDYLYLPIINMQNITDKTFTFAYAYARASASHNDILRVQASSDCGATWADLANLNANTMQNGSGGIVEAGFPYFPFSKEEWKVHNVNSSAWNNHKNSPTLLIRFNFKEGSAGHGNNLFIDAINIGGLPAPAAPVLSAVNNGDLTNNVSWIDNSNNEDSFNLFYTTGGAGNTYSLLTSLPANTTMHTHTGLSYDVEYCYKVAAVNNIGSTESNVGCATPATGLSQSMPTLLSLNLYPNPTNSEATLEFNLAAVSAIKVNVFDVTGRVVLNVADNNFAPGAHSISINKNNALEKGVYFVNMNVNGKALTRKLLID